MKIDRAFTEILVRAPDKTITFTGAAGAGAVGAVTVYTITGRVAIIFFPPPFCTTGLTEAGATATVALGTASATGGVLTAANAVDIDTNEWWTDPISAGIASTFGEKPLSENLIITVGAQNVNGGVLVFQGIYYIPLTSGAGLA